MSLLFLMNVIWAGAYTIMKWGLDYMAPMHFLFVRMFISLIVLFPFSIRQMRSLDRRAIIKCAMLGAVIAISHGFGFAGVERSHAIDASILYAIEPVMAIIVARIILKEKMDLWRFFSLALALSGFFVLSNVSFGNLLTNVTLIGNFLLLIGVFADGFFSPLAKPVSEKYPARAILTTALMFTNIFILPFALATPIRSTELSWQAVISVLYLSVICTCIGWTMWIYFLSKYPVNVVALTVFIQPVIGPFIAHFAIGEEISARVWFGGSIILIGVFIAVFKRKPSAEEIISEGVIH